MNNEGWAKQEQDTVDFLNSISDEKILRYINDNDGIELIYSKMEHAFESKYLEQYPNDCCMFNVWSTDDLEKYLEDRFDNLHFMAVTSDIVKIVHHKEDNE